jgi:surfactin synthase thioesterase subunit
MSDYLDSPVPAAPLRLFCFPYAGGGSALYRRWQERLGPQVAVCPVNLPGRERRARHPRFIDMGALVAELNTELGPYLNTPYMFFGHSMGASIAYRLAQRRWADGGLLPRALLLSAAPSAGVPRAGLSAETDPGTLARLLVDLGGLPEQVLSRPDWLEVLMPVIQDDLLLCASDVSQPADAWPLPIPFHLFGGRDDPLVDVSDLAGWQRHSVFETDVALFQGGHFYLRDDPDRFLASLKVTIARDLYASTTYADTSSATPFADSPYATTQYI